MIVRRQKPGGRCRHDHKEAEVGVVDYVEYHVGSSHNPVCSPLDGRVPIGEQHYQCKEEEWGRPVPEECRSIIQTDLNVNAWDKADVADDEDKGDTHDTLYDREERPDEEHNVG